MAAWWSPGRPRRSRRVRNRIPGSFLAPGHGAPRRSVNRRCRAPCPWRRKSPAGYHVKANQSAECHLHPRRARAQSQEHLPRHPARPTGRRHRFSGSGKSSLAFDIVFAEGQRRFLDSMSPMRASSSSRWKSPMSITSGPAADRRHRTTRLARQRQDHGRHGHGSLPFPAAALRQGGHATLSGLRHAVEEQSVAPW